MGTVDKQVYISKGGKITTRRNYKFIKRLILWVGLQVIWGTMCVIFNLKVHPHPFWKLLSVQYAVVFILWYLQMYSIRLRGIDIVFAKDVFGKWDVIRARDINIVLLIFNRAFRKGGYVVYRCFPIALSRKRWCTIWKIRFIRLLIMLKLIK